MVCVEVVDVMCVCVKVPAVANSVWWYG